MATAKYGKGTVFAVADPVGLQRIHEWAKPSPEYDNLAGAVELVNWLVKQVPRVLPLEHFADPGGGVPIEDLSAGRPRSLSVHDHGSASGDIPDRFAV